MEDLDLELRLAPYLPRRGTHGFITSRTDGDDNSDEEVHDVHPSRKKICLFRYSSLSAANAHLDLDLRLGIGDPLKESGDGVASCSLDDIIEFVLPYLDKESLVRSKAVSRSWNRLVSARSHLPIKSSFSGIVFQDTILASPTHDSVKFLELDCTGDATLCSPHGIGRDWVLVDSCNGLLLFLMIAAEEICVYNPIKEAIAIVPQAGSLTKKYGGSCNGLAFDGQQYQVVSIFRSSDNEFDLQIFFSNEIASRRLKRRRIGIPDVVNRSDLRVNGSFFSFKGCLSFLLCDWLLLYVVEKARCSYMRLPHGAEASIHRRCMWQSEGRIYYGFGSDDGGFQIWELVHYGDHSDFEAKKCQWEFIESYKLETLVIEYPEIFGAAGNTSKYRIGPCAFNDDFQILYLHSPGKLVAYHLKTRRFQMAFTYPDCKESGVSSRVRSYCCRPKPCNFLMEGSSGDLDRLAQNASSLIKRKSISVSSNSSDDGRAANS